MAETGSLVVDRTALDDCPEFAGTDVKIDSNRAAGVLLDGLHRIEVGLQHACHEYRLSGTARGCQMPDHADALVSFLG
ncbi:hypothetical protein CcI49_14910 [Frankia sp. CcI49]|nr:hypothetical protein ACG83_28355 [Frankia sp. R43]ONH59990.1 hypothetical protein CcI49_14910 [Frankia sp. CcI49]